MRSKLILFVLSASILLAIGCSRLTTENYDRLKIGMDYDAVVDILGDADECSGAIGIKNCRWGDEKRFIAVNFAGNTVVMFSGKGL